MIKRVKIKDFNNRNFIVEFHKNEFLVYSSEKKKLKKFDNNTNGNIEAINIFIESCIII